MMQYIDAKTRKAVLKAPGRYCELRFIFLEDQSDRHNNPVQVLSYYPRQNKLRPVKGKLFFVRSVLDHQSMVIISHSPDMGDAEVKLDAAGNVTICPHGYRVAYTTCELGKEEETVRKYITTLCPMPMFAMLNNWGDGNGGRNISQAFYEKEIDSAAEMGLDVVQIDDGWQKGVSGEAWLLLPDGTNSGYRSFGEEFWDLNTEKFPDGLEPLVERAAKRGIHMGLWFAPDCCDHFAKLERDVAVLRHAYDIGFRYFKLDMVIIKDEETYNNFLKFLDRLHAFGDDVSLQLDVTDRWTIRLGFLDGCGYGKIFVENRYAGDGDDYFPFLTLHNLWRLAHYMPAQRFQFEIPNVRKFANLYDPNDPLSPDKYPTDWLLASVMVSCPLFWMEAQDFDSDSRAQMAFLMQVWRRHRDALAAADISPIGQVPDGLSISGFLAKGKDYGYLIVLRDLSEEPDFSTELPRGAHNMEVLAASENVTTRLSDGKAFVRFADKRRYVVCRFEIA